MLGFYDVAVVLRPAADLPVVPAAEALHRKTVFQDIFAERFYDLLQLRFEGRVEFPSFTSLGHQIRQNSLPPRPKSI